MTAVQTYRNSSKTRENVVRLVRLICSAPVIGFVLALLLWDAITRFEFLPSYLLPGPFEVASAIESGWEVLANSWWYTIKVTMGALVLACLGGVLIATVFSLVPYLERALTPLVVMLQVTPVVAIAPLIMVYAETTTIALLICAWIVAFFPILSNTLSGLRMVDRNLLDLFNFYGATRWQKLALLRGPSALPYFLAGLRVSAGLSLIGAVTAEMVAGTGGWNSGLASRIIEASFRMDIPRMYAALTLLVLSGVLIHLFCNGLSAVALRNHKAKQSSSASF